MVGCGGIGNGAVRVLGRITSLQHLDLHWCSFGDKGMLCLTLSRPKLRCMQSCAYLQAMMEALA